MNNELKLLWNGFIQDYFYYLVTGLFILTILIVMCFSFFLGLHTNVDSEITKVV